MSVEGESPADGPARTVRALLFSFAAVWLSLTAHVTGGGTAPPVVVLAGAGLLTTALASLLAGRRRGPGGILGLMLALEFGLHHLFSLSGHLGDRIGAACAPMSGGGMDHAMGMGSMNMGTNTGSGLTGPAGAMCGGDPGGAVAMPAMAGWHLLAAAVLAVLLAQGERTLWLVLTWFLPAPPATPGAAPIPTRCRPTPGSWRST